MSRKASVYLSRSLTSTSAFVKPPPRRTMSNLKITSHNQYKTPRLVPECLDDSPLVQFHKWMAAALDPVSSGEPEGTPAVHEPEAMVLGTVEEGGKPSSRVVLLKELDKTGFLFFTNYNSRKSRELTVNPYASLTFYWRETSRSIRVSGRVERLSAEASDAYFQSRPRGSRLGAYASKQSSVVGENTLEDRVKQIEEKFGKEETDGKVPCPEFWGGWRVVPDEVEFWSGQPSRLHDRFRYLRLDVPTEDGKEWQVDRLSP